MDHDAGVITHPKFRMWLRPDGVVQLVWAQRVAMRLEDAIEATDSMAQLAGGRQSPCWWTCTSKARWIGPRAESGAG